MRSETEGGSEMSKSTRWRAAAIAAGAIALAAGAAQAQDKELIFGLQCDRTGATQTVGISSALAITTTSRC